MSNPTARFVRLAMPQEAGAIAGIQHDIWSRDPLTNSFLDENSLTEMTRIWHQAIISPPLAHYRVLVAVEPDAKKLGKIVGFVSVGPSDDSDANAQIGQILELMVDPNYRRLGHGSRLITGAVDTLRADGYQQVTYWVNLQATRLRAWVEATGWAADGAWQEIGDDRGETKIKQIRLQTLTS